MQQIWRKNESVCVGGVEGVPLPTSRSDFGALEIEHVTPALSVPCSARFP